MFRNRFLIRTHCYQLNFNFKWY